MIRSDYNRIDPKRQTTIDHKKQQFALPLYKQQEYPYRLNLYETPPTADITLEEFEQWAIDRLRSINLASPHIRLGKLTTASPRRARSLLLPQQNSHRNRRAHKTSPRQMASSITQLLCAFVRRVARSETPGRTPERPLLTLHPPARLLLDRRPSAKIRENRDRALQTTISER